MNTDGDDRQERVVHIQQQPNQQEGHEDRQSTSLTLTGHEERRDVSQAPESRADTITLAKGFFTVDGYLELHTAVTYWQEVLERAQLLLTFHPTTCETDKAAAKLLELNEAILGLQNTAIRYWRAADGGEYLAKLGGWETTDGEWTGNIMEAVDGRMPAPDGPIWALATDQRLHRLFYDADSADTATLSGQGMALEADLDMCALPGWDASMAMERVVYIVSAIKRTVLEQS